MNNNASYWLEMAADDLITAHAMFDKGRHLWMGFLCHLVIEKCLKAGIAKQDMTPPKSHDLIKLARQAKLYDKMSEEQQDFLEVLLPLCIEARYPTYKDALAKELNRTRCEIILKKTEELQQWIQQLLGS